MKFNLLFLLFIFFSKFSFAEDKTVDPNLIHKNLRCLVCQGQSVYDSDSEFAISLKTLVKQKLNEGLSEYQIYNYLKIKYGEWILYDPELNKNTIVLWLLPILIFLIGGAIIFKNFFLKNK